MKKVRYMYWVLALVGFVLPISRIVLMNVSTTAFGYLFALAFKTSNRFVIWEMVLAFLSAIALCSYVHQLIRLSLETTTKAKRGYTIATLLYSSVGGAYLLIGQNSALMIAMITLYFIVLGSSTYVLKRVK